VLQNLTRPLWLAVALSLLGAAAPCAGEQATVTALSLFIRSGPGLTYPANGILGRGARVDVLERQEGWLKITREGKTGFIRLREDCVTIEPGIAGPVSAGASDVSLEGEARRIARQIEAKQNALQGYARQESGVLERLDSLERSLAESRRGAAQLKGDLLRIEVQLSATGLRLAELNSRVHQAERQAAARMVALYKLGRLGRLSLLASAASIYELVVRERHLGLILAQDDALLDQLAADQREARQMAAWQQEQRAEKIELQEALKEKVALLAREGHQRQQLLANIRDRRELAVASLEALTQAAAALDRQIQALTQEVRPPSGTIPALAFATRRGGLAMPVQGKIVARFGPFRNSRYDVVNFRSGIDIRADRGEPIHAVSPGRILFSDWFKGYGNMLIIDHGENYCTVYAHLEELFKEKGAEVESGEVIATVGDSGSGEGPKLYFEVRHHGKPLDPMDWIRHG